MKRLIAAFAGVGLVVASTCPLSASVVSAPTTKNTEQDGGSRMREPLTILAQDHQSTLRSRSFGWEGRPNASTRSSSAASRVHGTKVRDFSRAASRGHRNAAKGSSRTASHGRGIVRSGPSRLPSANQKVPGSLGSPGSFGHGTGQSDSIGILDPTMGRTGAGQISPRAPSDGDLFPGRGLSAGQDVVEFLNRQNLREPTQNLTQPSPTAAKRQKCRINCFDAVTSGATSNLCGNKKDGDTTKAFLCAFSCETDRIDPSNPNYWAICIDVDNCPKLSINAKLQEEGPLGQPTACSWNNRSLKDRIRCPKGTKWYEWQEWERAQVERAYEAGQELGKDMPLLADFELGACLPDNF